jgi:cytochrome c biogenesis protein CcmG/thiol:disulfide interchange protein DsbE
VVARDGTIAYKLVGEITSQNIEAVLKPEIEKALKAGS